MTARKIRTTLIVFENTLPASKLNAFRGAMVEKVGRQHTTFHNHTEEGFLYAYPLIQYKRVGGKLSLFCIGDGVDEIHHFFSMKNWSVNVQGELLHLKVDKLDLKSFTLNVWDKKFHYQITNWLALNAENYKKYKKLESEDDKIAMLEKMLTGNILSFAKGIEWQIEKTIEVKILEIRAAKLIRYKGVPLMAFDVHFSSNVFLPNYLGLGKSASHGYGVVREINNSKDKQS
mgnify:CR=1 FL=1